MRYAKSFTDCPQKRIFLFGGKYPHPPQIIGIWDGIRTHTSIARALKIAGKYFNYVDYGYGDIFPLEIQESGYVLKLESSSDNPVPFSFCLTMTYKEVLKLKNLKFGNIKNILENKEKTDKKY